MGEGERRGWGGEGDGGGWRGRMVPSWWQKLHEKEGGRKGGRAGEGERERDG